MCIRDSRHREPDGQICCWFIEFDPSVFLLFTQTRFVFDVPLGSTDVTHLQSRWPTSSVIAGRRGAKAGVSPPRRIPPCKYNHTLDNSYFNRLLCLQLILEAVFIGIVWTMRFGDCPSIGIVQAIDFGYVLSIDWNCPDNWLQRLSINWNFRDNGFRRPSTGIVWALGFECCLWIRICLNNWFRRLSINWNCPDNLFRVLVHYLELSRQWISGAGY